MAILLEGKCEFTENEREFIAFCSGPEFPWYHGKATQNFTCLTHYLFETTKEPTRGVQRSYYAPQAEMLFMRICRDNGINIKTLYRMSLNLTFSDPSKHGDPHKDHDNFEHKILILYLNEFADGVTFLMDDNYNVTDKIFPAKDKFVVFNGCTHAQGFCRPQQHRLVLVATFDGDISIKTEVAA